MRLVAWRLPDSRSGFSMSTLVYSRLAAFLFRRYVNFVMEKISHDF